MARGQMQEVILVEVSGFDPDVVGRAPGSPDGASLLDADAWSRDRALRRLRRWWPVAAGLVLLLVASTVATGVRDRNRAARLAALPGVLAPLDPSLRELWREPQRGWSQFDTIDGDVLMFGPDLHGVVAVVAVDGSTGAQRWSAELPEVSSTGDVWCVALGDAEGERAARLACRVVTATAVDVQNGNYRPQGPVRLVVLDAETGERVAERNLASENVALAPFEQDLIVAQVRADGRAEITREDAATGEAVWSFRSVLPDGPGDEPLWLSPSVQHGIIVANGPVTWAFDPDGTVLGEWHLKGGDGAAYGGWWLDVSVLPDGRFAVGESGGVRSGDDYGTVSATDQREGYSIPGPVLEPTVDDGSAGDVLFTASQDGSGLVALDSTTGARLWESSTALEGGGVLLDGRLISMDGNDLVALDARSGAALWTVPVPTANQAKQVLTDGTVIVVPMYDSELGPVLTAFDPADGRRRWAADVPSRLNYLAVVDGRLLAMTDRDLIALG